MACGSGISSIPRRRSWPAASTSSKDALPEIPFYSEYFDGNPESLNTWATYGISLQGAGLGLAGADFQLAATYRG
jgi:hypothetical protein